MELSFIFQVISNLAIILGIVFGILNLRNFQKKIGCGRCIKSMAMEYTT